MRQARRRLLNSSIRVLHFLYLQDKIKVTVNARPTLLIVSSTPRQDDVGCRSSMFLLENLNLSTIKAELMLPRARFLRGKWRRSARRSQESASTFELCGALLISRQ